jgi:photosystem II stability/assembly factor-like uncharacterized protein
MYKRLLLLALGGAPLIAQAPDGLPSSLQWRNIGPNRGGRSIAVSGSTARPNEYYFGATGGGLWKTTDGGTSWAPVTDGQLGSSSVGAVAVAPSNPDVVWLGTGETQLRGNVMQGDGVYRSVDGGRSWRHVGLRDSRAIGRIRVDPSDPDRAYVAVLGDPFVPSSERGVYRTTDGGKSWSRVLWRSERAGAVDLAIDPSDPQTLYATFWEVYRKPWMLWSGGEGSGLFKSTDGGDTWTELTRRPGMPRGVLGKMTVTVSGADARRLWVNIEAEAGGLYRSDDGGATWTHVTGNRDLWQRAFYFLRVVADPRDRDIVYVLSFQLEKSTDGGRTFTPLPTLHADHHDLWIDPGNPLRMVEGNDGGASVSQNGGRTWTAQRYPTAQIYRVTTTDEVPFDVCGAQQDNTTVCVPSRAHPATPPGSAFGDWFYEVGGGESADIATRPGDPNVFYAGSTNTLTRIDRRDGSARDVQPHPRIVMGEPASAMPERWNWTYPIATTPLAPRAVYAGSQHLWKSPDEGRTWRRLSPDLTRGDPATLGNSGGPIVFDQDGPEVYATIFAIAPSPRDAATIWTGSDDGLVHVTRDGGRTWRDVTPPGVEPNSRISRIDASPHDARAAVVAVERHQMGDRAPHVWRTTDAGTSWRRITDGLPPAAFVRVVREDPVRRGLLFAGTEHGVYVSYDDGMQWQSLSRNLPDVQVSDLVVRGADVVIATHGRSFWVLDDIAPLRDATASMRDGTYDAPSLLAGSGAIRRVRPASIDVYLPRGVDSASVSILDPLGRLVRTLPVPGGPGLRRLVWDLTWPGATSFPGIVLEGGNPARGVLAAPGRYAVQLHAWRRGERTARSGVLDVRLDPRLRGVTDADVRAQTAFALTVRNAESAANDAVLQIRAVRGRPAVVRDSALLAGLAAVEGELYQVRNRSPKDKIAFPIKLNDRLTGLRSLVESGDGAPTAAQRRVFAELRAELNALLNRLSGLLGSFTP